MRILILGLDGAGKTTILYRLQAGEVLTFFMSNEDFAHPKKQHILGGDNNPNNWLQCGNGDLQEPQVPSVGPRRTD